MGDTIQAVDGNLFDATEDQNLEIGDAYPKETKTRLTPETDANIVNTIRKNSMLTQKKLDKKSDVIFSIYGRNWIIPWHFF